MHLPRLLAFLALALPFAVSAQAPNQHLLDSLNDLLKTTLPDTQRARLLAKTGVELLNMGMMDSARARLDEALVLCDETGNSLLKMKALNAYGISYFYQGRPAEALSYWEQAYALGEPLGDAAMLNKVRMNMANAQQAFGNYPAAVDIYLEVLRSFDAIRDTASISLTYGNLGVVYGQMGKVEESLDYFQRALAIDSTAGNAPQEIKDRINMGNSLVILKRFPEAERHLNRALEISRAINHPPSVSQVLLNMGNLRMEELRLSEAIDYLNGSNAILAQLGDAHTLATNQGRMAIILNDMAKPEHKAELDKHYGGDRRKALAEALVKADSSLAIMTQFGDLEGQKVCYSVLSNIYANQGKFEYALDNHVRFKMLSDSLLNLERDKKITQAAMQYTFDKQQAEARFLQEKKDARQATIRNSIAGGLGGALIFLFVVVRQRNRISREKQRSEELLLNILPEEVAEELKAKGSADARHIDEATILFTDFKDFTALSETMSAAELVDELNTCFKVFDGLMAKYQVEKIKTIGDAYMAAGGLSGPQQGSPADVVRAALDMQVFMANRQEERKAAGKPFFEMRVGIHTGPVVAGIVGVKKFQYDIWGDTVNTASRMESAGEIGRVNISETTWQAVKDTPGLDFVPRGKVAAKGKGAIDMWFAESRA